MIEVRTRSGGGLILIDRSTLARLKARQLDDGPDMAGLLSIAVDSEGRTDQVNRWAGERWPEVWKRETAPLVQMANAGDFAAVVFRCGDYYCDLSISSERVEANHLETIEQWIEVPSGVVVIADLGKLAEDWEVAGPVEHDSFVQMEAPVADGWTKVSFMFPHDTPVTGNGRERVHGSIDRPFCVVRCNNATENLNQLTELPIFPK